MSDRYVVHGARGAGGVAVEAALTLLGRPYSVVENVPRECGEQGGLGALHRSG